jgi:hypothetical protein
MDEIMDENASAPLTPRPRFLTTGALCTALGLSVAYVLVVLHYSVNVPQSDEWENVIPIAARAVHGNLGFGALWGQQFNESHLFIPNIIFALVAVSTRFNVRVVIGISAICQCASFFVLLGLVRTYFARTVNVVTVVALGVIWLTMGGIDNALWGYQIQLSLTVLFVTASLLFLAFTGQGRRHERYALAASMILGLAACATTIQGFLVWPVGLLVLLWKGPGLRAEISKLVVWCSAAALALVAYFISYQSSLAYSGCSAGKSCTVRYGLEHVGPAFSYLLALLGNFIPVNDGVLNTGGNAHLVTYQVLGGLLLVGAVWVVAKSWRERRQSLNGWVPVALIVFGLLWDISIALSRVAAGALQALESHYSTPQIFIWSGTVVFVLNLLQARAIQVREGNALPMKVEYVVGLGIVGVVIAFIITGSNLVGFENATLNRNSADLEAQVIVNLERIPASERPCFVDAVIDRDFIPQSESIKKDTPALEILKKDGLSTFGGSTYVHYRKLGPPVNFPYCHSSKAT